MQSPSSIRPCTSPGPSASALLGRQLYSPALRDTVFESHLDVSSTPILGDHRFDSVAIVPGAYFLAMAIEAARRVLRRDECRLEDVSFAEALALPDDERRTVQLILSFTGEPGAFFKVVGRPSESVDEPCWTVHATGVLAPPDGMTMAGSALTPARREQFLSAASATLDVDAFYDVLRRRRLLFGPAFRGVQSVWVRGGERLSQLRVPDQDHVDSDFSARVVSLDACLQTLCAMLPCDDNMTVLPVAIDRLAWFGPPQGRTLWCRASGGTADTGEVLAEASLFEDDGRLIASLHGVRYQCIAAAAFRELLDSATSWRRALCRSSIPFPRRSPFASSRRRPATAAPWSFNSSRV